MLWRMGGCTVVKIYILGAIMSVSKKEQLKRLKYKLHKHMSNMSIQDMSIEDVGLFNILGREIFYHKEVINDKKENGRKAEG